MKKILVRIFLVLLTLSISPLLLKAQTVDLDKDGNIDGYDAFLQKKIDDKSIPPGIVYPVRNIVLDTLNKPIDTIVAPGDDTINTDSVMYEYNEKGKEINKWKTKYEKKGHSRSVCEPPMLNITFDKLDSKGKPKELFTGITTYPGYNSLQYQKLRLVADCDVTEYGGTGIITSAGLGGSTDIQLMDYSFYKILRLLGVPAVDPIAFVKLSIKTSSEGYAGKTYNYMALQRDNEKDDQIPFVKQFNLDPGLIEDGKFNKWSAIWREEKSIDTVEILDVQNKQNITLNMDIDSAIRYNIITNFLMIGDRSTLHNEDYAKDLATGNWKAIPYGFDLSMFGCNIFEPSFVLNREINLLGDNVRDKYKSSYYRIAREIFGNKENLYKMLLAVDQFPFNVDKNNLKRYIKLAFHRYSSYYTSQDFAANMGQKYVSLGVQSLFKSEQDYNRELAKLYTDCRVQQKVLNSLSVKIDSQPVIKVKKYTEGQIDGSGKNSTKEVRTIEGNVTVTATAKEDTYIPKNNLLDIRMYSDDKAWLETNKNNRPYSRQGYFEGYITENNYTNLENVPGPYYLLRKGNTSKMNIRFTANPYYSKATREENGQFIYDTKEIGGNQYAKIEYMYLEKGYEPLKLEDNKSNIINPGPVSVDSIPGFDPRRNAGQGTIKDVSISSNTIENFKNYEISWYASKVDSVTIGLFDERGRELRYIIEKKLSIDRSDTLKKYTYIWRVPYLNILDHYKLRVTDVNDEKTNSISDKFELTDYKNSNMGSMEVVGSSTVFVIYNKDKSESSIRANIKVKIKPTTDGHFNSVIVRAKRLIPKKVIGIDDYVYAYGQPINSPDKKNIQLTKNKELIIDTVADFNPKTMFKGQYEFSVESAYGYDSLDNSAGFLTKSQIIGDKLMVIGETSPYITSIYQLGDKLVLSGVNFKDYNTVKINKIEKRIASKSSTSIEVNLRDFNMPIGEYYIVVSSDQGDSNMFMANVLRPQALETQTKNNITVINQDMESLTSLLLNSIKLLSKLIW